MTQEEMSHFTFSFRFKEAAGAEWMNICPWNHGLEASQVLFHADGIAQRVPSNRPDSEVHMANESMYAGFRMNWILRRRQRSLRKGFSFQYFYKLNQVIHTCLALENEQHLLDTTSYDSDIDTDYIKNIIIGRKAKLPRISTCTTFLSSQSSLDTTKDTTTSMSDYSCRDLFGILLRKMNSVVRPSERYLNSVGENLQLLVSAFVFLLYVNVCMNEYE